MMQKDVAVTAPTLMLLLLTAFPPKADMTLRFQDISLMQALGAAKLVGLKTELPIPPEGRVGLFLIEVRGNIVTFHASKLIIQGDPVRSINGAYNRRTDAYYVKAEALGGIIELDGVVPKATVPISMEKSSTEKPKKSIFRSFLP